jgi:S-formylglutathione hydrolase FrmB
VLIIILIINPEVMKKIAFSVAIILFSVLLNVSAQPYIKIDASFYSPALDKVKMIDIFLPGDYYQHPNQYYATIYYLHGGGGNQNSGTAEVNYYYQTHYADTTITSPPAIYVRPDGSCEPYMGSSYVNSELYGNYEDFIMQDVITFIETNFRAYPNKNFRYITGVSMGGFGSGWLAASYPHKFRACFPYAGFLSMPDTILNTWKDLYYTDNGTYNLQCGPASNTQLFLTTCGAFSPNLNNPPCYVDFPFDTLGNWIDSVLEEWYVYDVSTKVKDLPGENELSWFFGCGTTDYMCTYPTYQVFMDSLEAYGIAYDYKFFDGGHILDPDTWITGMHWMDSIINLSFVTLGVENLTQPEFTLTAYPNPVKQLTTIRFELSKAGFTGLSLWNQYGQHMESLIQEKLSAGIHSRIFDASLLPPGIYFLRLQAGDRNVVKKIVKVK